jgi:hypothetical protein
MFEVSVPFLLFEYFRIPYRLSAEPERGALTAGQPLSSLAWLRWQDGNGSASRSLHWVNLEQAGSAHRRKLIPGAYRIGSSPVFGHVATEARSSDYLRALGGVWSRGTPITDPHGHRAASVWEDHEGNVFLPFDPGELIRNFWSERYQEFRGSAALARAKGTLTNAYYLVRPIVPRSVQIELRRSFSRIQLRSRFPSWPVETALHDLYSQLLELLANLARAPIPWLAPWPKGYSWAFVLTHDVETAAGCRNVAPVRAVELSLGYRSSWNFVPRRYPIEEALLDQLAETGFEIGVHGLYHDGRDLESSRVLERRLPAMRSYAERWNAVGFRAPSTQRAWELMPRLGFDYDSSYPDTDPFEPQSGGCCTWLPYTNQGTIELPMTLVQDHTLFVILQRPDEKVWLQKAEYLKQQGGMALALTHPDYLDRASRLGAYQRLLSSFSEDGTAWRALPREVSAWWRRRGASRIEFRGGTWRVIGPAVGEAVVRFARPNARLKATAGPAGA